MAVTNQQIISKKAEYVLLKKDIESKLDQSASRLRSAIPSLGVDVSISKAKMSPPQNSWTCIENRREGRQAEHLGQVGDGIVSFYVKRYESLGFASMIVMDKAPNRYYMSNIDAMPDLSGSLMQGRVPVLAEGIENVFGTGWDKFFDPWNGRWFIVDQLDLCVLSRGYTGLVMSSCGAGAVAMNKGNIDKTKALKFVPVKYSIPTEIDKFKIYARLLKPIRFKYVKDWTYEESNYAIMKDVVAPEIVNFQNLYRMYMDAVSNLWWIEKMESSYVTNPNNDWNLAYSKYFAEGDISTKSYQGLLEHLNGITGDDLVDVQAEVNNPNNQVVQAQLQAGQLPFDWTSHFQKYMFGYIALGIIIALFIIVKLIRK